MSITYTKSTNFTAKDSMSTSNPDKVLSGVPFDAEFDAISAAFDLAAPALNATFTGTTATETLTATTVNGSSTSNWDTAYGWGDHSVAGYLTSADETDPTVPAHVKAISSSDVSNWNTAYGWGNHASAGYVSTETDPVFSASDAAGISASDIANWDEAYDDSLTAITFNSSNGVLTFTKEDTSQFTVDLDGRYATIAGIDTYTAGAGLVESGNEFSHANTSSVSDVNNSGQTFIQDITFDQFGHVASVTSAVATDTDTTYSAGDTIAINGSNEISHGSVPNVRPSNSSNNSGNTFIQDLVFDQYGHVTDFAVGTATDTNTDTTYTAGSGLDLSGTTFSHDDTSSQSSVSNSSQTFIRSIGLDAFGHITSIVSEAAADTNTTYSAGTNLGLSGTTFSLDTSLSGLTEVETDNVSVGNYDITLNGSDLVIKHSGNRIFKISSSGDVVAAGNITAYGSP